MGESVNGAFFDVGEFDFFGSEAGDVVFAQVFEEGAEGDDVVVLSFFTEVVFAFVEEAVEMQAIVVNLVEG